MTNKTESPPRSGAFSGTVVFYFFVALLAAAGLVYVGKNLYDLAAQPSGAFYTKLGELTLQLAVIVIVGALIKVAVDWGSAQRRRHLERLETRMDFMRRVRAAHVTIEYARDLLNAHRSAKTYGEQLRRLMELRSEVEEISEDLQASPELLFRDQGKIREGLEGIIAYLNEGGQEYVANHGHVDYGYKKNQTLEETIEEWDMQWVKEFMAGGPDYREKYVENLSKAKGTMRSEVYGA